MGSKRNQRKPPLKIGLLIVVGLAVALFVWSRIAPPKAPVPVPAASVAPTNAPLTQTNVDALLPTDPVQLINYGTELLGLGQPEKAAQLYSKALELNPDDEEGHFGLAVAYTKMGRTNDAIEHYDDALKIFPDYAEAHNNLGNIYLAQGKHEQAVQHYLSALKAQPQYTSAMNNLGKAMAQKGKIQEALHYFQEALVVDTNYVEARFNLATTLLTIGQSQAAAFELNEVLRQKPGFPPATQILARLQQMQATNKPVGP
jgi:tetratricopeptide (TPR) repeat protein